MSGSARFVGVFVLGLAAGVAGGWAVFHRPEEISPTEGVERTSAESGEPALVGTPAALAKEPAPSVLADSQRLTVLRTGGVKDLWDAFPAQTSRVVPAEAVPVLLRRLEEAIESGDKALFGAAAQLLVDSKHPEVVQAFARLTTDPSVDLPRDAGRWFGPVISQVRSKEVALAARKRYEEASQTDTSWITEAWLQAVVGAGDADDVAWALERSPRTGAEALARTTNPAAVERFREEAWKRQEAAGLIGEHLEKNPDGWPWALDVAERWISGERAIPGEHTLRDLLATIAWRAPAPALPRLKELLHGVRDARLRIEALGAIASLARRGVDTSDFDAFVQAPRIALEAIARGTEDSWNGIRASTLIYAIEYNRVTWSEESARTLDALAARPAYREHATHVARLVRSSLSSRWKEP